MCNAEGEVIGIRIRSHYGKFCVGGSKTGLFLPLEISSEGLRLIVEGNTDTAAGSSLGYSDDDVDVTQHIAQSQLRFAIGHLQKRWAM